MVTIGMNYRVLPDKGELFERAVEQVLDVMKSIEGHTKSSLYREVGNANAYLIVSEWKHREAFDNFIRSETFARVTSWGREKILADRPVHTIYQA